MPTQICPPPRYLDDLDLMARGAIPPRFDPPGHDVVLEIGPVSDATIELVDPEGLPLAVLSVEGSDETYAWGPVELLAPRRTARSDVST